MSKIFVHAKTMIDGVSDAPKFDQLITCEDGKITAIEPCGDCGGRAAKGK